MSKIDFYGQKPKRPYFIYQALMGLILGIIAAIVTHFFK
jgi:hypothetical protein